MPPVDVKLPHKPKDTATGSSKSHRLIQNITFFGDSAIPEGDAIYTSVYNMSKELAQAGFTIVNGGGPGIMKAATDGAESVQGDTIAIYWQPRLASFFEGKNLANITDESETSSNYLIRTLGLIESGDAYIVCKGGTGTVSEFAMVWCLAKLYYGAHKPVILFGDFWDDLIEAFRRDLYIDELELSVLYKAQTAAEVIKIINAHEEKIKHSNKINRGNLKSDELGFVLGSNHEAVRKTFRAYNLIASDYHAHHAGKLVSQEQLEEFMSMINAPAQVLDIGSGPGHDAGFLAEKYSVTGIEMSRRFYEIAKYENPDVDFINADVITHDLGTNKFKGIWARDAIHHIPDSEIDNVFNKMFNALVDGGVLYLLIREGHGEIIEEEKNKYATVEKFYHLFSEKELEERAIKAGFKKVRIDHTQRSHKWLVGIFKK